MNSTSKSNLGISQGGEVFGRIMEVRIYHEKKYSDGVVVRAALSLLSSLYTSDGWSRQTIPEFGLDHPDMANQISLVQR